MAGHHSTWLVVLGTWVSARTDSQILGQTAFECLRFGRHLILEKSKAQGKQGFRDSKNTFVVSLLFDPPFSVFVWPEETRNTSNPKFMGRPQSGLRTVRAPGARGAGRGGAAAAPERPAPPRREVVSGWEQKRWWKPKVCIYIYTRVYVFLNEVWQAWVFKVSLLTAVPTMPILAQGIDPNWLVEFFCPRSDLYGRDSVCHAYGAPGPFACGLHGQPLRSQSTAARWSDHPGADSLGFRGGDPSERAALRDQPASSGVCWVTTSCSTQMAPTKP